MDVYLFVHKLTHKEYMQKIAKSVTELADAFRSNSDTTEQAAKAAEELAKVLKNSKCGRVES